MIKVTYEDVAATTIDHSKHDARVEWTDVKIDGMVALRQKDTKKWTLEKLADKYNCSPAQIWNLLQPKEYRKEQGRKIWAINKVKRQADGYQQHNEYNRKYLARKKALIESGKVRIGETCAVVRTY